MLELENKRNREREIYPQTNNMTFRAHAISLKSELYLNSKFRKWMRKKIESIG